VTSPRPGQPSNRVFEPSGWRIDDGVQRIAIGRSAGRLAEHRQEGLLTEPSQQALGALRLFVRRLGLVFVDSAGRVFATAVSALERGIRFEQLPELISRAGLPVAELELVQMADAGTTRYLESVYLAAGVATWAATASKACSVADSMAASCGEGQLDIFTPTSLAAGLT
jgi:hypothetical protein